MRSCVGSILKLNLLSEIYMLLLLFCFSCSDDGVKNDIFPLVDFMPIDTISITVSDSANYVPWNIQYDSKLDLLYSVEPKKSKINIYSLESRNQIDQVRFESFGPNGIGQRITAYNYVGNDSIFVTAPYYNTIHRCNVEGEILESYEPVGEQEWLGFIAKTNSKVILENGSISLMNMAYIYAIVSNQSAQDAPVEYKIDLSTGKLVVESFFPECYNNIANSYFYDYSRTVDKDGNKVYLFAGSPFIYVKGDSGQVIYQKKLEGPLIRVNPNDPKLRDSDPSKHFNNFIIRDSYAFIEYDAQKSIYFLGARRGLSKLEVDNSERLTGELDDKIPIIYALDEQFNVISWLVLPRNKYLIDQYFIRDGIIYLSFDHPYNDFLDEDKMSFVGFRLGE